MPDVDRLFPEPTLQASGSQGLPPLPAEGLGLAPAPTVQTSVQTVPQPQAPPQPSGFDIDNMTTGEKIAMAVAGFAAGYGGRGGEFLGQMNQMRQQKLQRQQQAQEQMENGLSLVSKGMEIMRKLPADSPGRAGVIEMVKRAAGPLGDQAAAALQSVGTGDEARFTEAVTALNVPAGKQALMQLAAGDSANIPKVLMAAQGMAAVFRAADQAVLPDLMKKAQIISRAIEQMPGNQFKGPDGKASFSMADVEKLGSQLPPEFRPTDQELGALRRNPKVLVPYGFKTDEMVQKEEERQAAAAEKGPRMRTRIQGDQEIQEEWDATSKTWKQIGTGPRFAKQVISVNAGADQGGLSPEAIDLLAVEAKKDRSVLANVGRGTQGAKDLRAVLNKMAANEKTAPGGPGIAATRAGFASDRKALDKLVPQFDALEAFENSVLAQGKVLVQLAKKVDTTGIPVAERWIRAGRQSVAGDTDVADFNTQLRLFKTEAARAITNPNLTGILSDSARHEMDEFLPSGATGKQVERVVSRIEADAKLRKKSYQEQIDTIKERLAGDGGKPAAAGPFTDAEKEKRYQEWKARQAK